jgi:hypothetical protein
MKPLSQLLCLAPLLALAALAQDTPGAAQPAQPSTPQTAPQPAAQAAANPASATDQWLTGSVDLGFRWVSGIGGSVAAYRSVVDLRQDFELFGLDFTVQDPHKRWFDRMDVRAYGWGGEPYNTAHVDAAKSGIYDFTFDYRNIAYFNALPSFANPFAPAGFDQQSFDTRQRTLGAELDLFPGRRIIPYLAFDRNSQYGNGVVTWANGASNQYPVPALFRDATYNYRGGVRFEYNRFHVTLEQGGTTFKNDDEAADNVLNFGDNPNKVLGQQLFLSSFNQGYTVRGNAIYSRGLVTATLLSWLTLTGQFLYSQPHVDVAYTSSAAGNLILFSPLAFYSGQTDLATGAAKQPHVTSNVGAEIRRFRRLRIIENFWTDRFHDAAIGFLLTGFTGNPSIPSPQNSSQPGYQVVNYNQNQVDAIYDLTSRISLRGGWRRVWGDAIVMASTLSQTGPLASGQLSRNVALAGATFRPWEKLRVNLDYEGASSDDVYFRTSLNDYQKGRARAQFQATPSLTFAANFWVLSNRNPATGVNLDFLGRSNSLSVYWNPGNGKRFSLVGEYDRATIRNDIIYLSLPFLNPAISSYRDNAHIASAIVNLALPAYSGLTPTVTVGGSLFISSGSRPTTYYQPLGRVSIPLNKHVSWRSEWRWYGLGEAFYLYEGFRAHTLTTGLHLTR